MVYPRNKLYFQSKSDTLQTVTAVLMDVCNPFDLAKPKYRQTFSVLDFL